jgi:beta-galactosidase
VRRVAAERRAPTDPGYEPEARPVQTLFADWTPANLAAHAENVEVYSNCSSVELTLNGKSLGSEPLSPVASPRNWRVDFEPGVIAAVCQDHKTRDELRTAGKPVGIRLTADRDHVAPTFDDLSLLTATVIDRDGRPVPSAELPVTFEVTGPAVVAATDNADNTDHESFQSPTHRAYNSWCVAAIKATGAGAITVKATSPGLGPATIALEGTPK